MGHTNFNDIYEEPNSLYSVDSDILAEQLKRSDNPLQVGSCTFVGNSV